MSREVLPHAGRLLVADQKRDGSWQLDTSQSLGSPTTYGTAVATWSARMTLAAAGGEEFAPAVAQADAWLRAHAVATVLDAAAVVLGLERASDERARPNVIDALSTLEAGQAPGGGWGPYVTAAPQVFDTALVLLALREVGRDDTLAAPAWDAKEIGDPRSRVAVRSSSRSRVPMAPGRQPRARRTRRATRSGFRPPAGRCWHCWRRNRGLAPP